MLEEEDNKGRAPPERKTSCEKHKLLKRRFAAPKCVLGGNSFRCTESPALMLPYTLPCKTVQRRLAAFKRNPNSRLSGWWGSDAPRHRLALPTAVSTRGAGRAAAIRRAPSSAAKPPRARPSRRQPALLTHRPQPQAPGDENCCRRPSHPRPGTPKSTPR